MELTNHGIGKRALALLLTAVLVLSLCATVMETQAEETYTVTFELDKGSLSSGDPFLFPMSFWKVNYITVAKGESFQLPSVRWLDEGKVLACWKDESGTEYQPGYVIEPEKDMKFTGEAEDKYFFGIPFYYTVIISPGESGVKGTKYIITKDINSSLTLPECPEKFSKEGCTFGGWKVVGSDPEEIYNAGDKILSGKSKTYDGKTFEAIWKGAPVNPDYKITYHFNDPGSTKDISAGNYVEYSAGYQVTIKGIDDALSGSREFNKGDRVKGCIFAGWSTTPGGPVDSTYAVGNTVKLSDDLDLYAVWEEASYGYTVKQHYVNTDNSETVKDTSGTAQIDSPIPYDKGSIQHDGKTYVFDPGKEPKEQLITADPSKNVIDVYYNIDTLNDENDTTTEADGIADKYQRTVTYKVENGTWADETTGDKTEVVTLMDGDDNLSVTGTASLSKAPAVGTGNTGYSIGRWNTSDGSAPTTVTASGKFEYTYHFLNESETIIITPVTVTAEYDGTEHTFKEFEAKKNGIAVTVTLKNDKSLAGHGRTDVTDSSNQTIDLASELGDNWRDYFTMTGGDIENAILMPGTIIVTPKQVDVKMTINKTTFDDGNRGIEYEYDEAEKELTISYRYDALEHTLNLESGVCALEGIVDGDKGQVSLCLTGTAGVPTVGVEHVDEGKETIDLKAEKFTLEGDRAGNYTIGKVDVSATISGAKTGDVQVDKLSVKITPRPVNYWTFGGSKIYNGSVFDKNASVTTPEGTHDGTPPADKKKNVAYDWPDYESAYDTLTDGAETQDNGFIVRREGNNGYTFQQAENEWPQSLEPNNESDAGIYDYVIKIAAYKDDATNGRENVQKNDYDVIEHNSYLTIYPQSITDNKDTQYHDVTTYISDTIAEYDPHVVEYTYLDREGKGVPGVNELPAFYTGVKLTDDFVEAYPYDGKPHIAEAGALRNDNNAEGKQDLTEGTDYTVTYYRQDDKGVWNEISDDKDFVEPGKIKIVYQGIGNYRNRIEKEYSIVSGNGGLIPPDPPTPGGPDVELDDHDHYAYIIGKPGGIVAPNGEITRAEIATVIFRLLKEEVREQYWFKENSFPDVEITDWYNNAVSTLEKLGVVEGKDDGLFHPDDPITRAEMATMMVRLYDYDVDTGGFHTKFDDVDPAAWYARYVAAAEELALFLGDGSTSHFYPDRSLTRAEAMTVYNRLLGRKPHKDGLLPEAQMILWPDNMDAAAWYYADVQEATNSHTCVIDGLAVGGERFERWLSPLPVRDWAALEQAWSEAHSGYDGHDVN